MIAYDLDGVLLSDVTHPDLKTLLSIRARCTCSVFEPEGKYIIITGRPLIDKEDTIAWFINNILNQPEAIYFNPGKIEEAVIHKINTLNELESEIDCFIESDFEQYALIKEKTLVPVHFFGDVIRKGIQGVLANG